MRKPTISLSKNEIAELMRLVVETRDVEINCEQCLALVAEYAERQLVGKSNDAALKSVEHHLTICAECREEYNALRATLVDLGESQ